MHRYLRVLGHHKNQKVKQLSEGILREHIKYVHFLNYRPSQIAACAVLIASNLEQNACNLSDCSAWQDKEIVTMTGYTAEMLKEAINDLAEIVAQNKNILAASEST